MLTSRCSRAAVELAPATELLLAPFRRHWSGSLEACKKAFGVETCRNGQAGGKGVEYGLPTQEICSISCGMLLCMCMLATFLSALLENHRGLFLSRLTCTLSCWLQTIRPGTFTTQYIRSTGLKDPVLIKGDRFNENPQLGLIWPDVHNVSVDILAGYIGSSAGGKVRAAIAVSCVPPSHSHNGPTGEQMSFSRQHGSLMIWPACHGIIQHACCVAAELHTPLPAIGIALHHLSSNTCSDPSSGLCAAPAVPWMFMAHHQILGFLCPLPATHACPGSLNS